MEITNERFVISPSESIAWEDVRTLRLLNNRLVFVLKDESTFEIKNLRMPVIDEVFRAYDRYLERTHKNSLKY